jgi:predicted TIM-barrel fold metal-dependent hydrolase
MNYLAFSLPRLLAPLCLCAAAIAHAGQPASAPLADHHQHLFSPAATAFMADGRTPLPTIMASDLVALLDQAGIPRAVVLSLAYAYGSPKRQVDDEYAKVRRENDWTAVQAALFPGRLVAFCSFNPLKDYAIKELERCAATPAFGHGIKLHFGNSDVQLDNPAHVAQLRQVFSAANAHHMAIVVHMRASISKQRPYGAQQARVFLEQLLPQAPSVPVQVAHLAGTGPGYDDPPSDEAMAVLAEAAGRNDPRTRQLWFDVASLAGGGITPAQAELLVKRMRQAGIGRILYGSDSAAGGNLKPREGWAAFRRLPLTPDEFARIANARAPYLR